MLQQPYSAAVSTLLVCVISSRPCSTGLGGIKPTEEHPFFKMATTAPVRLPRNLDFEGEQAGGSSGKGQRYPASRPADHWGSFAQFEKQTRTLWRSARTLSPTKDDLTCEQDLYARHLYLLVHHCAAAAREAVLEAPWQAVLL